MLDIIHMWFVIVIAIHLIDTWDFTVFNSELLLIMITLSVSWNSYGYKNYMLISIKKNLLILRINLIIYSVIIKVSRLLIRQ